MTTFLMEVLDLKVFDEEGTLITNLDKSTESELVHNENGSYFYTNIVNVDLDLIKALGEVEDNEDLSDFDRELNAPKTKIKFKHPQLVDKCDKVFKLIAEGYLHNSEGDYTHKFKIIAPEVFNVSGVQLGSKSCEMKDYTHVFEFGFDENGDSFQLEIEEI